MQAPSEDPAIVGRHRVPVGSFARVLVYPLVVPGWWEHRALYIAAGVRADGRATLAPRRMRPRSVHLGWVWILLSARALGAQEEPSPPARAFLSPHPSRRLSMRTHRRLLTVVLGLLAAACAAPVPGPAPAASWSADEAQIRSAIAASSEAWNRGDLRGHLAIYVDTVTFMTRAGPRPGVAAIEESFANTYFRGGQPRQQLRFEQVVVRPLGRDAALQTGRFVLSGGGEPEQSGWFTLVWVRTAQGWRAVHDHSS